MIVGSGMIAQAFQPFAERLDDVCVYAYGVSNSTCDDTESFLREELALSEAIKRHRHLVFVYFGTCSVGDVEMQASPYVMHKLRMEEMVCAHGRSLIVRLPQVAGFSRNQKTLINFLSHCVVNELPFELWVNAWRNIIDVTDISATVMQMLDDVKFINRIVNVANTTSYSMKEIVFALENIFNKKAVYRSVERGSSYSIDTTVAKIYMDAAGVKFGADYLYKVIERYKNVC